METASVALDEARLLDHACTEKATNLTRPYLWLWRLRKSNHHLADGPQTDI
jgi:hypothetical protein